MSDYEKAVADTLKQALPSMTEFDKGRLLGGIEQIAITSAAKDETDESEEKEKTAW